MCASMALSTSRTFVFNYIRLSPNNQMRIRVVCPTDKLRIEHELVAEVGISALDVERLAVDFERSFEYWCFAERSIALGVHNYPRPAKLGACLLAGPW